MTTSRRVPDDDLVEAACAGSRAAFAHLVTHHQGRLFRFLRLRCRCSADAEELAQETLLRCWSKLSQFDRRSSFATWMFTIASRLAVSRGRRPTLPAATERELEDLSDRADPPAELAAAEERDNLWDTALRVLGPEVRAALWLCYAEDLNAPQIAEVMGKRPDAVRAMLSRGRAKLAAHLAPVCQPES